MTASNRLNRWLHEPPKHRVTGYTVAYSIRFWGLLVGVPIGLLPLVIVGPETASDIGLPLMLPGFAAAGWIVWMRVARHHPRFKERAERKSRSEASS